jgi:formylmethanofuran dehydrogenase subunit E
MDFMKKSLMVTFILLLLISCDKTATSFIINNRKDKITVKVKMDQVAIEKLRKEHIEKGFMLGDEVSKDYEVKIDSSETYIFDIKMGTKPDYYDIKEIEIFSGDTLILKCRKDQMQKLFTSEKNREGYNLIIN